MTRALSMDIRIRFSQYISQGYSARGAGRVLLLSPATSTRLGKKVRNGTSLEPKKSGRKPGTGKLAPYADFMIKQVENQPDITLFELRDTMSEVHNVKVHHSAIDRFLKNRGFTYKKRPDRNGTRACKSERTAPGMEREATTLDA